ncbi:unnamed protein product [Chrysoparadoxa australica]
MVVPFPKRCSPRRQAAHIMKSTSFAVALAGLVGPAAVMADFDLIAGYEPATDVVQHNNIDLDLGGAESINACLKETPVNYACAQEIYENGKHSFKSGTNPDGTPIARSIAGFSTGAPGKLDNELFYETFRTYWQSGTYADDFTRSALEGTGVFAGAQDSARIEGIKKGAAYQNVWMYVIWEMEDAIRDCDSTGNGVHAWDEAMAFYTGSLEGTDGTGDGVLPYSLADKRCENFATCIGNDAQRADPATDEAGSRVNIRILDLFKRGRDSLRQGDCLSPIDLKKQIVEQMTVPLVQGSLRYVYLNDPVNLPPADMPKAQAELWSFVAAILPRVASCDQRAAAEIRKNTQFGTSNLISDGHKDVKQLFESTYKCMGITCADVGQLSQGDGTPFPGMEMCSDGSTQGGRGSGNLPGYGVALIVILAILTLLACVMGFFYRAKAQKDRALYEEFQMKHLNAPAGSAAPPTV